MGNHDSEPESAKARMGGPAAGKDPAAAQSGSGRAFPDASVAGPLMPQREQAPYSDLGSLNLCDSAGMRLFDPCRDLPAEEGTAVTLAEYQSHLPAEQGLDPASGFPSIVTEGLGRNGTLPGLPLFRAAKANPGLTLIPREEDCLALWDRYFMPGHIRRHSRCVANLARGIARAAVERGFRADPDAFYAAGLLHDLGKAYCIAHGGNHAQVGAAWVMRETRNGPIAQGVRFHVHWPWEARVTEANLLPMAIIYADKRVMHDSYVTIVERFRDLYLRYGDSEYTKQLLRNAKEQGLHLESQLSSLLGVKLDEYIADSGRLVRRT